MRFSNFIQKERKKQKESKKKRKKSCEGHKNTAIKVETSLQILRMLQIMIMETALDSGLCLTKGSNKSVIVRGDEVLQMLACIQDGISVCCKTRQSRILDSQITMSL